LAKTAYITRHDAVVRFIHWALCRRLGVAGTATTPNRHKLEHVITFQDGRLLWEFGIPTDKAIKCNRPDIVLHQGDRVEFVEISIPLDVNIIAKEADKINRYQPLCNELRRIWNVSVISTTPVIFGSLGAVTSEMAGNIQTLCDGRLTVRTLQQQVVLGSYAILRNVLG